ncbi:MAG: hypothetical protein IH584_08900 [Candidatus Aminicenantes bacterium]|nr:hypothetical protein [Candidatus Aminicenantes bacterium]
MNCTENEQKHGAGRWSKGKNRRLLLFAGAAIVLAAIQLPAITVLSPNGGENWVIGSPVTVRWTPTAAEQNVRIMLYRGGTADANRLGNIVDSVRGNTGSFSWTAGVHSGGRAVAGNDYRVRVKIVGVNESDFGRDFSLLGTIAVSEPMETAAYEASTSTLHVAWTAADVGGNVRIDLERQDGAERYVVSDSVAAGGSPLNWPIPLATAEGTYRVRVSQGASEGSSGRCHIMAYRPPGLAVLQPNGGEELVMGRSYPVRWRPRHLSGNVRVELLKDGRLVGVLSDSSPVGGMCTYYWDAKTCGTVKLLARGGYKVRVSTLDGLHSDVSDRSFSLTLPPNIILFDPGAGDTWVSGTVEEIRWNATKMEGYLVTIELHFPDPGSPTGSGGFIIARDVPGTDRRFAWTVGTVLNAGRVYFNRGLKRNCTIKLRATKGTSVLISESRPFNINTLE